MIPSFLITSREMLEVGFIITVIFSMLKAVNLQKMMKSVLIAAVFGLGVVGMLIVIFTFLGSGIRGIISENEQIFEGSIMLISAVFITWTVFSLHNRFAVQKGKILSHIKMAAEQGRISGLAILTILTVLREGLEIILALSTVFISENLINILLGVALGSIFAFILSLLLYLSSLKMPIMISYKLNNILLVLFAGSLISRGIHELIEIGIIPKTISILIPIIPNEEMLIGKIINIVTGLSGSMDIVQIIATGSYLTAAYLFILKNRQIGKQQ
jgi:high-affinity iron transporter